MFSCIANYLLFFSHLFLPSHTNLLCLCLSVHPSSYLIFSYPHHLYVPIPLRVLSISLFRLMYLTLPVPVECLVFT